MRNLFDRFPEYEKVRVTTGWFNAVLNGETVIDERIKTQICSVLAGYVWDRKNPFVTRHKKSIRNLAKIL